MAVIEVKLVREAGWTARLVVRDTSSITQATRTLLLEDGRISVYQGTGDDVFDRGNPALVLEGYSGGAHCCYTYQIVDLGEHPIILSPIRNQSPFFFFKDPASNQYRIMTSDGAFDYFDGRATPVLRCRGSCCRSMHDGLHDVSPQFAEQYDTEIAAARAKIAQEDITKSSRSPTSTMPGRSFSKSCFLICIADAKPQAWQTLDEMWPAERSRRESASLIVETRAKGTSSRN